MLALLLACTTPTVDPPAQEAHVEPVVPEAPPPPFAAPILRDGLPPNTTLRFQETDAEGDTSYITWEVRAHPTPDSVTFLFTPTDVDGTAVADGMERTFAWTELESHAHFPAGTSRARASATVGEHAVEGWRYTVTTPDGAVLYTFADRLPGPPVLKQGPGAESLTLVHDSRL